MLLFFERCFLFLLVWWEEQAWVRVARNRDGLNLGHVSSRQGCQGKTVQGRLQASPVTHKVEC